MTELYLHFEKVKLHTKHMLLIDMSPVTHESWHCLSGNIQIRTPGQLTVAFVSSEKESGFVIQSFCHCLQNAGTILAAMLRY